MAEEEPQDYSPPVMLFHWSPSSRHKGISRFGLVPGKLSTDRLWRPPYVAFADDPSAAWAASGMQARGAEHDSWDLWMVGLDAIVGFEMLWLHGDVHEYRVYERVFKRDVWYVGTRRRDA